MFAIGQSSETLFYLKMNWKDFCLRSVRLKRKLKRQYESLTTENILGEAQLDEGVVKA